MFLKDLTRFQLSPLASRQISFHRNGQVIRILEHHVYYWRGIIDVWCETRCKHALAGGGTHDSKYMSAMQRQVHVTFEAKRDICVGEGGLAMGALEVPEVPPVVHDEPRCPRTHCCRVELVTALDASDKCDGAEAMRGSPFVFVHAPFTLLIRYRRVCCWPRLAVSVAVADSRQSKSGVCSKGVTRCNSLISLR